MTAEPIKELSLQIKQVLLRHGVEIIETSFVESSDLNTYFHVIIPNPAQPLGNDPSDAEMDQYYQTIGDHIGIITSGMSEDIFFDYYDHNEVEIAKGLLLLSFGA